MKKMLILLILSLLVTIITCLLPISCSSKPTIVGYWQDTQDNDQYIEFTIDGKSIIDDGEMIFTGTYELISENYIKFDNPMIGLALDVGADTIKYQISGDTLKLGGDNSKTFKRVR